MGELTDIPTDALIDMLYIILAGEIAITASDAKEIEQIQRELQRRGHDQCWTFQTVNGENHGDGCSQNPNPSKEDAYD